MSAHRPAQEYDFEPLRGLPERLPEGEEILWQGAPSWRGLARRVFHARKVAVYFALLVAWLVASGVSEGEPALQIAGPALGLASLGLLAVGLLGGLAWLTHRTTVYTVTNRRVVLRVGIALPVAINLPFRGIQSAVLRPYPDGSADIPFSVHGADRIGYLMLWPHVRPWHFGRNVQPMLRAVPEARSVARLLTRALATSLERTPAPARRGEGASARAGQARAAAAAS